MRNMKVDAMSEFLSTTELHALTGYARPSSQASWLKEHGIPHRLDGRRIIVSREHIRGWLEGRNIVSSGLNLAACK